MSPFTSSDAIIARHLFAYRKCEIYQFHDNYLLSPAQIFDSLIRLKELNICGFDFINAFLLEDAEVNIMRVKALIFNREKVWRQCPISMQGPKIPPNSTYIPSYKRLDKRILHLEVP